MRRKEKAAGRAATTATTSRPQVYPGRSLVSSPVSPDPFDRLARAFVLALADCPGPIRADVLRRRVRAVLQEVRP